MNGNAAYFGDLWRARRIRELGERAVRGSASILVRIGAEHARWALQDLRRHDRHQDESKPAGDRWIGPALRGLTGEPEREVLRSDDIRDHAGRQRYRVLHDPWESYGYEVADRAVARSHLFCTEPYYDRRVVEAAFAIPESARWRGRDSRALSRALLAGRVSHGIAQRTTKAEFSPLAEAQDRALCDSGSQVTRLTKMQWVDPQFLEQARTGGPSPRTRWLVQAVEAWVETAWG
jgi:asparagine synthetase B (glutamine-hydrolysing)